jgi:methylglyoxal reductase
VNYRPLGNFRANELWNAWVMPANRPRVLDLLGRWKELTDKCHCTLAQLVIAWTAAQPGVSHVLAGGRIVLQVTENVRDGELKLAPADIKRIREDVVALGEPAPAGKATGN